MAGRPAFPGTERRLSRRRAVLAGSFGVAAAAAPMARDLARGQEATPVLSPQADLMLDGLSAEIIEIFRGLPGTHALKLWAPPDAGRPAWSASLNADTQLFIASAFKTFALAEYLRQAEEAVDPMAPLPLADQLDAQLRTELALDERVFSLGSAAFNSPSLTGKVTMRSVLEAMIGQSDNTATDMVLKDVGPERVRQLIAALGLEQTRIPDSTRQFNAYVYGDPDWPMVTWPDLLTLVTENPHPHRPLLNDEITMASTPDDLVSFYARALQGQLFRFPATLAVFRAILSRANTIALSMPLGVNAFLKSGWGGVAPEYVLSVAGGVYVPDRWIYVALILNWTDEAADGLAKVQPAFHAVTNSIVSLVRDRIGA